ncbi:hypothetical protein V8G54_024852 [Vigna mungo]|uniref:Uncharacterized protein n=1 Tax=Vigna mungo TaxID=3915 RepID=A0AAQ3N7J2_VIGMU
MRNEVYSDEAIDEEGSLIHIALMAGAEPKYAKELLEQFKTHQCNTTRTPLEVHVKLRKDETEEEADETRLKQIVGSLRFLCNSRPDLVFGVGLEGPHGSCKRILRYIRGTSDYGILFPYGNQENCLKLSGFCGLDYGGNTIHLLHNGAPVSWSSKKQSVVALSSCEAEYLAGCYVACQGDGIGKSNGVEDGQHFNHQPCMKPSEPWEKQAHRNIVNKGKIELCYCKTAEQWANLFSKSLAADKFEIMRKKIGVVSLKDLNYGREDAKFMKNMNLDSYRFSISWSRILPNGKLSGGINQEGIDYYNNVINELLANGIKPLVTLFHWDLPQTLEDEYGGFLTSFVDQTPVSIFSKDFRDYADVCFKAFGDRVKHWVTLNEPWTYSINGYANGTMAPGRCSSWVNPNCVGGDSGTEPYIVSHYQLLAHAAAVRVYKTKYQASQKGLIGITLVCNWFIPFSDTKSDQKAAERSVEFMYGWFMDPLTTGEYPKSMRALVKSRLPKFTAEQARLLIGSFDFIGINYYSSIYASDAPHLSNAPPYYVTDSLVISDCK